MEQQTLILSNGLQIPQLGFGTWQLTNEQVEDLVTTAIGLGYRSIDTAAAYGNERGLGRALQSAAISRDELFITTKLHDMEGYEHTLRQCDASLERLGLEYIDLYLIHWPFDEITSETWRALEDLYRDGRVRAIGVANFSAARLEILLKTAHIVPMVNQVELHPYLNQKRLRDYCTECGIQIESWSPLIQGRELLEHPTIAGIAVIYNKTPAQIILRWHVQHDLIAIPKSTLPEHIQENLTIFDFTLSDREMYQIDALNQHRRANPVANPETFMFTPEIYKRLQRIND